MRAVPVAGGTKQERGFVRRYVDRIRAPKLVDVQISTARPRSKQVWGDRPALWLTFTTPGAKPDPVAYVRGQWQAMLIAGAIRDAWSPAIQGVRPAAGYTFNRLVGKQRRVSDGAVPVRSRPETRQELATTMEVRELIEARAPEAGLDIDSIGFERPLGVAPIIRVTVDDPDDFVATLNDRVAAVLGNLINAARIDGFYIEGHHDAELIEAAVFARRLNTSTGWVNPTYA